MNTLPSWIKPYTTDAYNYAYTFLYCKLPKEVREHITKIKNGEKVDNDNYLARHAEIFFHNVGIMAEYEMSFEDLKALERKEKLEGIHPSQHKKSIKKETAQTQTLQEKPQENTGEGANPS
jgi:hypothetical protein